jgi:hypothetical protein
VSTKKKTRGLYHVFERRYFNFIFELLQEHLILRQSATWVVKIWGCLVTSMSISIQEHMYNGGPYLGDSLIRYLRSFFGMDWLIKVWRPATVINNFSEATPIFYRIAWSGYCENFSNSIPWKLIRSPWYGISSNTIASPMRFLYCTKTLRVE